MTSSPYGEREQRALIRTLRGGGWLSKRDREHPDMAPGDLPPMGKVIAAQLRLDGTERLIREKRPQRPYYDTSAGDGDWGELDDETRAALGYPEYE